MKLKVGSKDKERKFLEHLNLLFEDPATIIPNCMDKGFLCPFESYRKKVETTSNFEKYSRSADQFLSALGETNKIIDSDSAPILGFITTPYGNVEYAKRGNTDPAVLAGVQHFDHEIFKLLAFSSLAKSKNVRVYSSKNFYTASCKNSGPGEEFFTDVLNEHGIQFRKAEGEFLIGDSGKSLTISHFSGVTIRIYENSQGNTLHTIMRHFLTRDYYSDFTIGSDYLEEHVKSVPDDALVSYFDGKIDDRQMIKKIARKRIDDAINSGLYIIGDTCYSDLDEFLSQFDEDVISPDLLRDPLIDYEKGMALETASTRKLLEILWQKSGNSIMKQMFPDLDEQKMKSLKGSPIDRIESARKLYFSEEVESSFNVEAWSKNAQYLVDLLKKYHKEGKMMAVRDGEKNLTNSPIVRAIFFGFLEAVGEKGNREWMFTPNEVDLGLKMKDRIKELLTNVDDVNEKLESLKSFIP